MIADPSVVTQPAPQPPQPDEDTLALMGLHPAQIALAHGLHSGAIHPQQVLDAATPQPPPDQANAGAAPSPGQTGAQIASASSPTPIAAPPVGAPAAAAPAPVPAPAPVMAAPGGSPTPIAANPRLTQDQAELERLDHSKSGIGQFQERHPILGGIARVAAGVGSAMFPAVAAAIPGTDIHHNALVSQARGRVGEDLGEEKEQQTISGQKTSQQEAQARIPLTEAQTREANANADEKENSTPKPATNDFELWARQNPNAPAGDWLKLQESVKPTVKPEKPDNPEQQFIDEFTRTHPGGTVAQAVHAYAAATQKPETSGANDARSDRSYQYNQGRLDKIRQPLDQLSQRFGRLQDTLNQHNPQADALVGPELLTVMAGGMGSGLRMNEAEISRIVGGRSAWENLKAAMQHWSTNPDDARSITPEQDKMIRALVTTVGSKLQKKQALLEEAQQNLLGSDDPKEHRQIMSDAQKKLDAVDTTEGQGSGGLAIKAPNGKTYTFKDQASADAFKKEAGIQ